MPGHMPMKSKPILFLCAYDNGDPKIKLLLVYHSENLAVIRKHNIVKNRLEVMWSSKPKAWIIFFVEWSREAFCPTVKKYLEVYHLRLSST